MLADAGHVEPSFTLRMEVEATDIIENGSRVGGVLYRTADGADHELRADVVVACDGRASRVRDAAGLVAHDFGVPMDVWWFRLPRHDDDPEGGLGRISAGRMLVLIDRGDYYQCASFIPKGSDTALRAQPVSSLHTILTGLLP